MFQECGQNHTVVNNTQQLRDMISESVLMQLIDQSIAVHVVELFIHEKSDKVVRKDLQGVIMNVLHWIFTARNAGLQTLVNVDGFSRSQSSSQETTNRLNINVLAGVEETLNCSILGLRGQLDSIARCQMRYVSRRTADVEIEEILLPIEYKTGKWRQSTVIMHRAQVILYVLMLAVRERCSVKSWIEVTIIFLGLVDCVDVRMNT